MNCNVLLFDGFETLDAFGPVEIFGSRAGDGGLGYYSLGGGLAKSAHGVEIATLPMAEMDAQSVLLVPGGIGTQRLVDNGEFIAALRGQAAGAAYVLTVCTGAALLARTGLLDGKEATTNKQAFSWATAQGAHVRWQKKARWVSDGKFYTSSGVTAGMDMALGFIAEKEGRAEAERIASHIEYIWNDNKDEDPFAIV